MDVPDLYQFLVKEVSRDQFDPDAIAIDADDVENKKQETQRPVSDAILLNYFINSVNF